MTFYNNPAKVDAYEKMCEGYDGSDLYAILSNHLIEKSTLLELGCGPGNDIIHLKEKYRVMGSDLSDEFLQRCKKRFPEISFMKLDAINIETDRTFDCIFSNKVLHHLNREELKKSLIRQQKIVVSDGIIAHTFWIGDKEFEMEDMLFVFHHRAELIDLVSKYFTILETFDYKEFEEGDSIFIVARNNRAQF